MSQAFYDGLSEFNAQYMPEKVKEFEGIVSAAAKSGSYDFDTVKKLMKSYNSVSGSGVEVNAEMVATMLALTLTKLPNKDYLQLSYLIPGRLNSNPQVAAVIKLNDMLERAQFPSFWKEIENDDAKAVTSGIGNFGDSIRGFVIEVVSKTWKNIDKSQLATMLGMSNPDSFLKTSPHILASSISGNVVEFVECGAGEQGAGKKQSDIVAKVTEISKLIRNK